MKTLLNGAAGLMLVAATTASAEPVRQPNLNDRLAELCTASDFDLVGKRMARQCRAEVRARWQQEQRLAAARLEPNAIRIAAAR